LSGNPPSAWHIVGRWAYALATKGKLVNPEIETAPALSFELPLGWVFHYAVGCGYAAIYLVLIHTGHLTTSLIDGFIFGAASVVVPWFMFLPCMGKGVFARNTPAPLKICAIALATHIIFGIGIAFGIQLVS
ncbi:MAG: DUF2938 family protein, partial [Candidatus Puniceispirillaceae bacterium]